MGKAIKTIEDLQPDPCNANRGTPRGHGIIEHSVRHHGAGRSGLAANDGTMIAGSQTLEEMAALGIKIKPVHTTGDEWVVVIRDDVEPGSEQAALMAIEDNRAAQLGIDFDPSILAELSADMDLSQLFRDDEIAALLEQAGTDILDGAAPADPRPSLAERFGVPPFSVLDARQGYWQARKRAWIALGIQSELGRGDNALDMSATMAGITDEAARLVWNETRRSSPRHGANDGMQGDPDLLRIDDTRQSAKRPNAAPGGSPLGAASLGPDGKTRRGDGRGLMMKGQQSLNAIAAQRSPETASLRDGLTWATSIHPYDKTGEKRNSRHAADQRSNLNGAPTLPEWAHGTGTANMASGTSIFDPVLCELVYRWFCPEGGAILDPFAGGSVRGIVASLLGRAYTGLDLRPEQIAANEEQAGAILAQPTSIAVVSDAPDYTPDVTPIEQHGDVWMKRDDLYCIAGVRGGKVRTCLALAQGADGLVTAGSRASPQVNIVAHIAQRLGIPCRVHTPTGALSPEVQAAQAAGAEVVQHKAGYNNVIIARAREDAAALGWTNIPFGMECQEAITQTRQQVRDIPAGVQRIVMPVGSGMSLVGVLWGLCDAGLSIPVLGVVVGAEAAARLDAYAPPNWRDMATLEASGSDYHAPAAATIYDGVTLDPHYEAKCIPFIQPGDLLWAVGIRQTEATTSQPAQPPRWVVGDSRDITALAQGEYDLIFSCPPYADLEVYSDDARDLSTLEYQDFLAAYREIVARSVAMLKQDRFAVFVVGDVRDKKGFYRNFVGATVDAFQDAGAILYNEAILVTAVGSLPIRIAKQFEGYRKLGKTHQNILCFYKGDPKAIKSFGPVEMGELSDEGGDGDGVDLGFNLA